MIHSFLRIVNSLPGAKTIGCLLAGMLICSAAAHGQFADSTMNKAVNFPSKFLGKIQSRTVNLDHQLTRQAEKYLQRMARREERLEKKLYRIDSTAARNLFENSARHYAALGQKLATDTGDRSTFSKGAYYPYADSLRCSLSFLQQQSSLSGQGGASPLSDQFRQSVSELRSLQAKMQDADLIHQYVLDREQQIKACLSHYTQLPGGLNQEYQGLNQDLYYYTQQLQGYKDILNDPDKLEKKVLSELGQLPAFQQFMQKNAQLAALFGTPANYGTPQAIAGLTTRDQMQQMMQGQLSSGGSVGMGAFEQQMETAQGQLDQLKDKLGKLGAGGSDVNMPDFKPNAQKTKTFWKRLEIGANFQTTQSNTYFPAMTDLGFSVGYRLSNNNTIGVGASYKVGWGSGFNHIALSSQGAGLRSFIDIRIKSSLSATGGLEYNYAIPIVSLQQLRNFNYWTPSGLIGLSKTVSVKSRLLKQTKLQLLWDFLSYQQAPRTQPILFRVGYNF